MKILALGTTSSGVSYHRVTMPLVYLANTHADLYVKITNHIDEEELENGYDLLIINRCVAFPAKELEAWKNKYGFKLIIDNDDHWLLDPSHVLSDYYARNAISQTIIDYIKIADHCTVTHDRLAYVVQEHNRNVSVIPNALPFGDGQFNTYKTESDKVRLFWSGSDTHAQDISLIRNPIQRILSDSYLCNRVKMVMAGYNERSKPIWDVMVSAFTAGLRLDATIFQHTMPDRYMGAYTESDICLVPLVTSTFNSMKSNLKVLEAACKMNPCIVSETNPYLNMPVCYAPTKQYWHKWVRELVSDPATRVAKGLELYRWALQNHNLETINNDRYELYSRVAL